MTTPNQTSNNSGSQSHIPVRLASATDLPFAGNNFVQASYSFVFTPNNGTPQELTLIVNPEEYSQSESSTSTVILTAGDIYSDSFGPGLTRIRMAGTFGQRPSAGSGSGQLEALRLRQFFRQYLDQLNPIITKNPQANLGAKLQFFNPKDNEFWDIEIPGEYLTIKRSKSSPFLYRYELNFIAMQPTTQIGLYDILTGITNASDNIQVINQGLTNLVNNAATYSQEIATISNTIGLGAVYLPNQILAPLTNILAATVSFANGSASVINYPLAGVTQLITNCQNMLLALDNTYNQHILNQRSGIDDGFSYDPNVDNFLTTTIQTCAYLLVYKTSFAKNFIKSDFATQTSPYDLNLEYVDFSKVTGVTYGRVNMNDTIETLAIRGMGSVTAWKTLAEFNNLAYPFIYIVDPNNPIAQPEKTLGLGMNIAFPIFGNPTQQGLVLNSNPSSADSVDLTFGTDFLLGPTQDIIFETSGATVDIQTVSGLANLLQAIQIKFNVLQGELITHLNFGLPNLLGYRTLTFVSAMAISAIKSTVLSDTRITSITNATVTLEDDTLNYTCSIQPNFTSDPVVLEGSIGGNVTVV